MLRPDRESARFGIRVPRFRIGVPRLGIRNRAPRMRIGAKARRKALPFALGLSFRPPRPSPFALHYLLTSALAFRLLPFA